MERVTRRELMITAAAGVGAAVLGAKARGQEATGRAARVRVAAVQMHATLGEVDANLENAEHYLKTTRPQRARGTF